jgi:hypothetical protein
MNITELQAKILSELSEIRKQLSAPSTKGQEKKEKKEKKPRDPNAKPNDWIVFTGRVRTILKENEFPAGKECQKFASHLKNGSTDAYSMSNEDILAARASWTPEEPVEKVEKTEKTEKTEKKAVVRKAAKKTVPVTDAIPPPEPVVVASRTLRPLPLKGKKYLWDTESNGLWTLGPDNSKGDWVGVLSADRKTIDTTVSSPA